MIRQFNRRRILLGGINPLANTFIGGEGVTTTTAAALETLLVLGVGDVTYFNLNGNDIEAFINVGGTNATYEIQGSTFNGNTNITWYRDYNNLVTRLLDDSFNGSSNLVDTLLEGCTIMGKRCFKNCTQLTTHIWNNLITASDFCFENCDSIIDFEALNMTGLRTGGIRLNSNLKTVNTPKMTALGLNELDNGVFTGCTALTTVTVDVFLQTNNAGGRDGDIVYAEDTLGATIIYI